MWENIPENIEDYLGFVYIIENHSKKDKNGNPKWYIGQKKFWFTRSLPPLKGKKNRRRKKYESDWKEYTGSSEQLNSDIENGDKIRKEILHLCKTKWEMNYTEALIQFQKQALLTENSYNGIIQIRLGSCPDKLKEKYQLITENILKV